MKRTILLLTFLAGLLPAFAQRLIEIGKGYSSTSINTTVFRNSSLVNFWKHQYSYYYDAECFMVLGNLLMVSSLCVLLR